METLAILPMDPTFAQWVDFLLDTLWEVLELAGIILLIPILIASGTLLGALKDGANIK